MNPASAQTPEINLDLVIDPTSGVPGTTVSAQVSGHEEVCLITEEDIADAVADSIAALQASSQNPTFDGTVGQLTNSIAGALPAILYPLIFADPVTQEPLTDTSNQWNPLDGTGTVDAPDVDFGTYAVAAICLDVNTSPTITPEQITQFLTLFGSDQQAGVAFLIENFILQTDPPRGLGVAIFCLGDEAFCNPPAEQTGEGPVAAEPVFTG